MNCVNTYKYKISIILPCYNVEEYIDNAVSAILKQTFKDYEVIFINDGSTDDTLEVIKKHCCHNNFRVFDFQNQGVAQARNEGMRLSQGEYLYFMDPDDDMDETLLEVALEECEKKHADAVQFHYYCQGASFNGDKGNAVYEGEEITAQGEFSVDSPPRLTKYHSTTERMSCKSVTFASWQRNISHSTTRH